MRVLVFCQGEAETVARDAGADYVGGDDLIREIENGFLGFDVSIATPDLMGASADSEGSSDAAA